MIRSRSDSVIMPSSVGDCIVQQCCTEIDKEFARASNRMRILSSKVRDIVEENAKPVGHIEVVVLDKDQILVGRRDQHRIPPGPNPGASVLQQDHLEEIDV